MPLYKVIAPGFMFGQHYNPEGKRRTLSTDKPLKPVPSWLQPIEAVKETAKEKKVRLEAEAAQAEVAKKKAEADAVELAGVTFLNPDSKPAGSAGSVTTL